MELFQILKTHESCSLLGGLRLQVKLKVREIFEKCWQSVENAIFCNYHVFFWFLRHFPAHLLREAGFLNIWNLLYLIGSSNRYGKSSNWERNFDFKNADVSMNFEPKFTKISVFWLKVAVPPTRLKNACFQFCNGTTSYDQNFHLQPFKVVLRDFPLFTTRKMKANQY